MGIRASAKIKKPLSQRYFNLVYFVDTGRTRSVVLRLDRLIFGVSVFGLLVLWALTSFFVLTKLTMENKKLNTKLKQSLMTIMDYQTRYDDVFEKAYSEGLNQPNQIKAAPAVPKVVSSSTQTQEDEAQSVDAASSESLQESDKIIVQDVSSKMIQNDLNVQFAIKNQIEGTKAVGKVWAVAVFEKTDGSKIFLSHPSQVKLDPNGQAIEPILATPYNIRFYRKREFSIKAPQGIQGSFKSFVLYVTNKGDAPISYPFQVKV